jgi:NAD+ synthase
MAFTKDSITINTQDEASQIIEKLKNGVVRNLKKRGAVVGISGGLDSSVVLALCVNAFGPKKVLGVIMPEQDSNPQSSELAIQLANKFEVEYVIEDVTSAIDGFGCYRRRDEAIKVISFLLMARKKLNDYP